MNNIILEIIKINGYNFVLTEEKTRKLYEVNIEFILENLNVEVGNEILISKEIFDSIKESNTSMITFGDLESSYGKMVSAKNKEDIIILMTNNGKFYLKRLYG